MGFVDGLSGLFVPGSGEGKGAARVEEGVRTVLRDSRLGEVERGILSAVERVKGQGHGRVLLVLDGLDLLLAATEPGAQAMADMAGELRAVGWPFRHLSFIHSPRCGKESIARKRIWMLISVGLARSRHCCHRLSRLPAHAVAAYAPRNCSCGVCDWVGASGAVYDWVATLGYGGGEGC